MWKYIYLLKLLITSTQVFYNYGRNNYLYEKLCEANVVLGHALLQVTADQLALRACGGFNVIMNILNIVNNANPDLPPIIPAK